MSLLDKISAAFSEQETKEPKAPDTTALNRRQALVAIAALGAAACGDNEVDCVPSDTVECAIDGDDTDPDDPDNVPNPNIPTAGQCTVEIRGQEIQRRVTLINPEPNAPINIMQDPAGPRAVDLRVEVLFDINSRSVGQELCRGVSITTARLIAVADTARVPGSTNPQPPTLEIALAPDYQVNAGAENAILLRRGLPRLPSFQRIAQVMLQVDGTYRGADGKSRVIRKNIARFPVAQ